MDLVAYSTQLLDEQRQYQEQLTEIVRGTEQVRSAKEAGKLIRLPAGDGMALVFFDSPGSAGAVRDRDQQKVERISATEASDGYSQRAN